ncbi:MAG: hypothetical protein ACJ79L_05470, partial [Anaeromyxobacteraceae bacterium]
GCYTLWRAVDLGHARSNELAVTAGTALPTGSHDASAAGALVDGQLGTGAWAPFLGLNYLVEGSSWVAFANVSGRLRAEGAYFDGSRYKSATRCSGASTDSIARCGSSRSTSAWTAATGTDRWKVRAGAGAHGGGHSGSCGGAAVLGRTPHDGFSDTSSN